MHPSNQVIHYSRVSGLDSSHFPCGDGDDAEVEQICELGLFFSAPGTLLGT